ncbi:MAG: hypothetical protein V4637_14835 [Pseudomonadota bacterium]
MMITDAIRHAKSEHVVHFLLTSYFEARAHADVADKLPPALKRLPFAGRHDLAERLSALRASSAMSAPRSQARVESEAMEILTAAWRRLGALPPLCEH